MHTQWDSARLHPVLDAMKAVSAIITEIYIAYEFGFIPKRIQDKSPITIQVKTSQCRDVRGQNK